MRRRSPFFALLILAACETAPSATPPSDKVAVADTQQPVATQASDQTASQTANADTATATNSATDQGKTADAVALVTTNHPKISDTQDFGAVTEKVSIEQDKALLQAQRKEFKVIAPTKLPKRVKTISVVQYALSTTNPLGVKKYSRFNPLGAQLAKRNCARYDESDQAQLAFLRAGGPRRDPLNLDPDGDGFACSWSPDTYRKLVKK